MDPKICEIDAMLKPSLLRYLMRMKHHFQLSGPLLTLGVQDILCHYDEAEAMLRSEGFTPCPIPQEERELTTSLHIRAKRGDESLMHARTFFRLAGVSEYDDLDASAAEEPTLVHDLNTPVPTDWHGRYQWVLDGGTLEHVFDVRSTLSNIVRLVRLGGSILHINPMSGWANHGFYQLSPCLYYDFYRANGFQPTAAYFATNMPKGGLTFSEYQYSPRGIPILGENQRVLFLFLARKIRELDQIVIPTQTKYTDRLPATDRLAG